MERIYADHSNKLKALGNKARKESVNTPRLKYSPSARKAYSKEVASLNSKLALVQANRPLERQAQLIAESTVRQKKKDNPGIDDETVKKIKNQAVAAARARMGAKGTRVEITPPEWEAIQAGAITDSKLTQILAKADMEIVKAHATPKQDVLMTTQKTNQARRLLDSGLTRAEVAAKLGVSLSTLDRATNG